MNATNQGEIAEPYFVYNPIDTHSAYHMDVQAEAISFCTRERHHVTVWCV